MRTQPVLIVILSLKTSSCVRDSGIVRGRGLAAPPPLSINIGGGAGSGLEYRYAGQSDGYGGYGEHRDVYGGQSDIYGGQNHVYGGQSDVYGGQSDMYGGQSDFYGGQNDVYGGLNDLSIEHSASYEGQSNGYGGQNDMYDDQRGYNEVYGGYNDIYDGNIEVYGGKWNVYTGTSDETNSRSDQSDKYTGHRNLYETQSDIYGQNEVYGVDESDIYAGGQASTAQTHGYTGWGEVQAPWQAHSTNTVYEGTGGFKPYYDNSQEDERQSLNFANKGENTEYGSWDVVYQGRSEKEEEGEEEENIYKEVSIIDRLKSLYEKVKNNKTPTQYASPSYNGEGEKPRAGKRKDTARSRGNTSNVRFPNFEGKGVKPGSRQEETHTDRSRMDIKETKARMLSTEEWLQYRQQRGDNIHYPRGGNKEMENDIITVDNLYSWVPPPKGPDVFTVNVESALKF